MGAIQTASLPGVGRKYWLEADDGGRISIIAYHDGAFEIYLTPAGEEFPTSAVRLRREEAAALADALPVSREAGAPSPALPDASCVVAPAGSPVIGREAAGLREGSAFVAAISPVNGSEVESPVGRTVRAADILYLMGPEQDREALAQRIRGA